MLYERMLTRKLTLKSEVSAAIHDCDFNRSVQHLISNYREEDVENENAFVAGIQSGFDGT